MGNSKVDRDREYMRKMWGTTKLASDYETFQPGQNISDNLNTDKDQTLLREIENDDISNDTSLKG